MAAGLPPERHLFGQAAGVPRNNAGLVILSTDSKPRLKWTPELHERFSDAVHQLGGPQKATPKMIMRFMGVPGITLYHLKSHLQKYRLSTNLQAQSTNSGSIKNGKRKTASEESNEFPEMLPAEGVAKQTIGGTQLQMEPGLQITEALEMQIEVQRRLHEQLEVQRHLQLRIEAQGKYLQSVLEKAEETLAKQNLQGSVGGIESSPSAELRGFLTLSSAEREEEELYLEQQSSRRQGRQSQGHGGMKADLDLNVDDEDHSASWFK